VKPVVHIREALVLQGLRVRRLEQQQLLLEQLVLRLAPQEQLGSAQALLLDRSVARIILELLVVMTVVLRAVCVAFYLVVVVLEDFQMVGNSCVRILQ